MLTCFEIISKFFFLLLIIGKNQHISLRWSLKANQKYYSNGRKHPLPPIYWGGEFAQFFFYDIDERRRYTKKVHPLKAWIGPSMVKRRRRGGFYELGRSWRCLWMRVLNSWRLWETGKTVAGSEFQSLEVIGKKELAKALVRFLSNLTAKGGWALENRVFLVKGAFCVKPSRAEEVK